MPQPAFPDARRARAIVALFALALAPAAAASRDEAPAAAGLQASLRQAVDVAAMDNEDARVLAAVLHGSGHPDMFHRSHGVQALRDGLPEAAHGAFLRAARHADKPSQAMLAEMYWTGLGVPRDRATAYAWMDLAAERHYHGFVVLREAYWMALDEAERARALEVGQALYAEYGDDVAKPRQEDAMERARRRMTGTHTGFVSPLLRVRVPGVAGSTVEVDASRFYDDRYWRPQAYWAWQDELWRAPPRDGSVSVGELEAVPAPDPVPAGED
jgi:hypothetical protein